MSELSMDDGSRADPSRPAGRTVDAPDPDPETPGASGGGLQEKAERTLVGRVLISVFVVLVGLTSVATNLPASQLRTDLGQVTTPFANVTGLDQDWTVFVAPRQISAQVYARVDYSSGPSTDVPVPDGRGLSSYVDYRWQKYGEQLRPDSGQWLWATYARYVVDQARDGGREPVRVSLVRRWADSNPPGRGPARGPWREYTMYTTAVEQPS